MTLSWETPPPPRHGGKASAEDIALLKKHPGRWALVGEGMGYNEVQRDRRRFQKHGIRTTTRTQDDGTYKLYVSAPKEEDGNA